MGSVLSSVVDSEGAPSLTMGALGFVFMCAGFGFYIAWGWLGLSQGYPLFFDGVIATSAVLCLLGGFAVSLLVVGFGFWNKLSLSAPRPMITWGVLASILCWTLLVIEMELGIDSGRFSAAGQVIISGLVLLVGACAAPMLIVFGRYFSCLQSRSTVYAFSMATVCAFIAFACVLCLPFVGGAVLFCAFPLLGSFSAIGGIWFSGRCELPAARSLRYRKDFPAKKEREAEKEDVACEALDPSEKAQGEIGRDVYASGFRRLLVAVGVFAFAIGFSRGMEPVEDFGIATGSALALFMVLALAVSLARLAKIQTFRLIKVLYTTSTIGLVFSVIASPFTASDELASCLYYVDYFVIFMVVWLLVAFVESMGELASGHAFALAFAIGAVTMVVGWVFGARLNVIYADFRYAFSIAVGCGIALYATVGFSAKSFPLLTTSGKGAEKQAAGASATNIEKAKPVGETVVRARERMVDRAAARFGLSPRETEIFLYMAKGHGSNYIAEHLGVSYYTVKTHRRNIYIKLGIHSQEELVAFVVKEMDSQPGVEMEESSFDASADDTR